MPNGNRPVRILHVIGVMNFGGVESWLMNVLRNIDRKSFQMDCLSLIGTPGQFDDEIRMLGSQIIPCMRYAHPLHFARDFTAILRQHGPYDIVHSHVHHYSGYLLWLAQRTGVPGRIAHSHTAVTETSPTFSRRLYLSLSRYWLRHASTLTLAASREAAQSLLGASWQSDKVVLHYCGIDLKEFSVSQEHRALLHELQIPEHAYVIGHVGRFSREKNHVFLLEVFAKVLEVDPQFHLLLVGDGALHADIKQRVNAMGLHDKVTFTGARNDVARLMGNVIDLLMLPSLYEGLPLVLVEAQASGVPCVVSDVVTEEATLIPQLMHRVSLTSPIDRWVAKVLAARQIPREARENCQSIIESGPFNIKYGTRELERIYAEQSRGL